MRLRISRRSRRSHFVRDSVARLGHDRLMDQSDVSATRPPQHHRRGPERAELRRRHPRPGHLRGCRRGSPHRARDSAAHGGTGSRDQPDSGSGTSAPTVSRRVVAGQPIAVSPCQRPSVSERRLVTPRRGSGPACPVARHPARPGISLCACCSSLSWRRRAPSPSLRCWWSSPAPGRGSRAWRWPSDSWRGKHCSSPSPWRSAPRPHPTIRTIRASSPPSSWPSASRCSSRRRTCAATGGTCARRTTSAHGRRRFAPGSGTCDR